MAMEPLVLQIQAAAVVAIKMLIAALADQALSLFGMPYNASANW
jgi:hypothetical protein